jgi:hypothetical protein
MQATSTKGNEQRNNAIDFATFVVNKKKKSDKTDRRLWEMVSLGGGGGEVEVEVCRRRRAERG